MHSTATLQNYPRRLAATTAATSSSSPSSSAVIAKDNSSNNMPGSVTFGDCPTMASPAVVDFDIMRGRKRDRSMTRAQVRSIRCAPSDESSTLRGRSRCRATSPSQASRTSSPTLISPTSRRLLQARLRREHCPSRATSPSGQQRAFRRRQRTRSRSRGPPPLLQLELESPRATGDMFSGLRNELHVELDHGAGAEDEEC